MDGNFRDSLSQLSLFCFINILYIDIHILSYKKEHRDNKLILGIAFIHIIIKFDLKFLYIFFWLIGENK